MTDAAAAAATAPSPGDDRPAFDLNLQHGHRDLVQAVAFNTYGDRCATGSVDGKIRVFNRHRDATWRLCDTWAAHGGEVLELQWLPASVYPNLIASLGMEGWFRLWAEDPSAAPGRRFCAGRAAASGRPAFDTRSGRAAPYRSFSMRHCDETRHTHLALLAADGRLTVLENDQAEALSEYSPMDELAVCARPGRGEEGAFRVRFDPNPEPCYAALRAGVPADALGLVVAAMDAVRVYRSRDVVSHAYGVSHARREFYLAAEVAGHRGLVRDVAWAPGNFRGYDMVATACQDGYARVFRIDTPLPSPAAAAAGADAAAAPPPPPSWSAAELLKPARASSSSAAAAASRAAEHDADNHHHHAANQPSSLSASLAKSGAAAPAAAERHAPQPGQVRHVVAEMARLDSHRTPVWRVGFDDDGHVLATTGDDGRLLCYRQTPDGAWAKSSELVLIKARMAAP